MTAVYPLYLNHIEGALAVVVGGGLVGERKVNGLLAAGAMVRLVSPEASERLQILAANHQIEWRSRPFHADDLHGALLVFAATNQRLVNAQVAQAAKTQRILCNVADAPDEGDFHVPAVLRQDGLIIAVGTGGDQPGRARRIRDQIAAWLSSTKN